MKGITYLRDEQDHLKAVQIDAELYGDALQNFLDGLEAEQLKEEPKKKFDDVAKRILAKRGRRMYEILITETAERTLDKLPIQIAERLIKAIYKLADQPRPS